MNDQTKSDSVEKIATAVERAERELMCFPHPSYCDPIHQACAELREIVSRLRALPPSATAQEAASVKDSLAVPLHAIEPGQMFRHGETLALMTEYGDCEAYIVGSGEMFWGGTDRGTARRMLLVTPCAQGAAPPPQPVSETAAQKNATDWKQAVDDALVTCLECTTDSYTDPKKAINDLICWNIAVATDPRVNGGFTLVPIEPTQSMLDANGRSEFPEGKEWLERDARETWAAMLAAAPRSAETGVEDVGDQDMAFARRAAGAIYEMNRDLPEPDRLAAVYVAGAKHHAEAIGGAEADQS